MLYDNSRKMGKEAVVVISMGKPGICPGPPLDFVCYRASQKKIRNIHPPNFCSTSTPTIEHLFVPALGLRHQGPFVEGPIGGFFWGTFTEGPYLKKFLEGPLFVHSCRNEGSLCGGPFMGGTYRGSVCGGPTKMAL